jgi:signal transduction histidine kinase
MARRTLRQRIVLGLLGYTLLLSAIIVTFGQVTNTNEEFAIQHSLLSNEVDDFVHHRQLDPAYPPPQSRTLHTYVRSLNAATGKGIPAELLALPPGQYDETTIADRSVTALIRDVGPVRIYMSIDLTEQESDEASMFKWALLAFVVGVGILSWAIWWLSGRMLRPVTDLAAAIDLVAPDERKQHIAIPENSVSEIATIARALNRYFERLDAFVVRETAFIDNVSHELRTPIAIIAGAAELIESDTGLSDAGRRPLARIRQTTADVEELISALLVLAKAPGSLRNSGETCRLERLVPEIVDAHEHLRKGKVLQMKLGELTPSRLDVSAQIAQIAIANILRNAIENTDMGRIEVCIRPAGVVRIQDSGKGMSPEEIGKAYTAQARHANAPTGNGIGLQLIRHICEHLDWVLEIASDQGHGTLVVLDMRKSLIAQT